MLKKSRTSIIIPVYNRPWCIKESIDSVLNQTCQDFELILIDDGSTDSTGQILEDYRNRYKSVKVIFQENKGVSSARNTGIENSDGEFIAFLDSDDLWIPEKLEIQKNFFEENDSVICQTEETWIRNGKRINPKFRHKKPSGDIFISSLALCLVSPSAVMMRREFFEKTGLFDTSMKACEDYDLWLRGAIFFDFGLIDKPLVIKRGGHEDQLSAIPLLDKLRIYSLDKILSMGIDDAAKRKACILKLAEKCEIYMAGCKKRGKWEEFFIYESLMNYWRKRV